MRTPRTGPVRRRTGIALVAALGLMMLAAGMLAGTAIASLGLQRAARTLAATARAESELRRGLALVLQDWDSALDSMPVGATTDRSGPITVVVGAAIRRRTHVRRLGPALYAATVLVEVGDSAAPLAFRRARLLVERRTDTTASSPVGDVRPLARWSVADLP